MSIHLQCPACAETYRLADEYAGKVVKCKKCAARFVVREDNDAKAAAAPTIDVAASAPRPNSTPRRFGRKLILGAIAAAGVGVLAAAFLCMGGAEMVGLSPEQLRIRSSVAENFGGGSKIVRWFGPLEMNKKQYVYFDYDPPMPNMIVAEAGERYWMVKCQKSILGGPLVTCLIYETSRGRAELRTSVSGASDASAWAKMEVAAGIRVADDSMPMAPGEREFWEGQENMRSGLQGVADYQKEQ